MDRLLTIKEVSERLNLCDRTIRNLIKKGNIKAFKISKKTFRVYESELNSFLESRKS